MWPATPSSKPKRENSRNAAARRCLRCVRSSSTELNEGGSGMCKLFSSAMPQSYDARANRRPSGPPAGVCLEMVEDCERLLGERVERVHIKCAGLALDHRVLEHLV